MRSLPHTARLAGALIALTAPVAVPVLAHAEAPGDRGLRPAVDEPAPERRSLEPDATATRADTTRELALDVAEQCGGDHMPQLRQALLALETPGDPFYVELWSDRQQYRLDDQVYYYVRSNRAVYVTLFWLGPDDGVFMPFTNVRLEADRTHRLDPSNIIVEPTGREAWRIVATIEPQSFTCSPSEQALTEELARVRGGFHAVARWEVTSVPR